MLSSHLSWTSDLWTRIGVTQEEGLTGFLHLPSAVLALIFIARRIQPSLSLVDREVEFCVPHELIVLHYLHVGHVFFYVLFFHVRKNPNSYIIN